jgi:hypothetical protein
MDDSSTTSDTLDQADEDILTATVSDDAIEAAAGFPGKLFLSSRCSFPVDDEE